jgi:hypothetical protein
MFLIKTSVAQDAIRQKITVGGVVTEFNLKLKEATVSLLKDGKKVKQMITDASGLFLFNLDTETDYLLIISKEGFVSKKLTVSTKNIPTEKEELTWTTGITVDIFMAPKGLDVSILNKPIGEIVYDPITDNFNYDKEYTKSVQQQLDLLQKELLEKRENAIKEAEKIRDEQRKLALEKQKEEELLEKKAR